MSRTSAILMIALLLAIATSALATYDYTIVRQDYPLFGDPEAVPEPSDFIAYLVTEAVSLLKP